MLKYSQAIYQGKIDQLTNYISLLEEHISKLTEYKSQLGKFWDDEEGMKLAEALQQELTTTNNRLTYLKQQLGFYQKLVTEYGGAAADVQEKIENVFQAMSSLSGIAAVAGM